MPRNYWLNEPTTDDSADIHGHATMYESPDNEVLTSFFELESAGEEELLAMLTVLQISDYWFRCVAGHPDQSDRKELCSPLSSGQNTAGPRTYGWNSIFSRHSKI